MDCTKVLGAVGWESKDGEEGGDGSLLLEGDQEGGGSFCSKDGGEAGRRGENEKFLFIDLSKGELRIL